MNRMNREEFFTQLAPLDEDRLKKALWNLYWRSSAPVRERIEAEIAPVPPGPRKRPKTEAPDPQRVGEEVREFTTLARAGAYLAGDRRVTPRERTRWRFTFRQLAEDARAALTAHDPYPAEEALAALIDLACAATDSEYFRSEDPVEAARFVVSDAAEALWRATLRRSGANGLAARAMPQLLRWESPYGWTRYGSGAVGEKEISLAAVLERLLQDPGAWVDCADAYLEALDRIAETDPATARRTYGSADFARKQRAGQLAEWHEMLLARLPDYDAADRLDRLTVHPALAGAEALLLRARWAHHNRETDRARSLVHQALEELPGHDELHMFAAEIGAALPPQARRVAERRALPTPPLGSYTPPASA